MAKLVRPYHLVNGVGEPLMLDSQDISVDTSLNSRLPNGIETAQDVVDNLGELAFSDSIDIPEAESTVYGVVKTLEEDDELIAGEGITYTAEAINSKTSNLESEISTLKSATNELIQLVDKQETTEM